MRDQPPSRPVADPSDATAPPAEDADLPALAAELAAMAQTGLHYARDGYDIGRYVRLREIAAALLSADAPTAEALADALAGDVGHATPKVDVRGWCRRQDGTVLFVQEARDRRWCLPGGWAEPGLTPSASVEKEVREEAGLAVRAERLVACFDRRLQTGAPPYPFPIYKLVFACAVEGAVARGDSADAQETVDAGWFDPLDPPPLSLGRTHPDQLRRLAALPADPTAAAVFD